MGETNQGLTLNQHRAEQDPCITDAGLRDRIRDFEVENGRRPRILLTGGAGRGETREMGALALGFADAGFDVDISPPGMTLKNIARMAIENDVHGVVLHAGHDACPANALVEFLAHEGADDIIVVATDDAHVQDSDPAGRVGLFVRNALIRIGG